MGPGALQVGQEWAWLECQTGSPPRFWDEQGPLPTGMDHGGSLLPVPPALCSPTSPEPLLSLSPSPRTHTGHIREQETEDPMGEVKCPLLPPAPRERRSRQQEAGSLDS